MRLLRLWTLLALVTASIAIAACSVPVDLDWGKATQTPTQSGTETPSPPPPTPSPSPDEPSLTVNAEQSVNDCYTIASVPGPAGQIELKSVPSAIDINDLVFLVKVVDRPATPMAGSANWADPIQATDAGLFAVLRVIDKFGDILTLAQDPDPRFGTGSQVCTFHYYPTVTISSTTGAAIVPAGSWNGETGGVVAFKADSLVVDGQIRATGYGFRGGSPNILLNTGTPTLASNVPCGAGGTLAIGGGKGEGLAGVFNDPATVNDCGRGLFATGAGGGNHNRGGGAGGGNGGAGGGAINSVPPTPSSAEGGRGAQVTTRLLMGGGGGGGQFDLTLGGAGAGGRGGGIIYIEAGDLSGIGSIVADGEDGASSIQDGAGGGGAGGTVHLALENPSGSVGTVLVQARGGAAGSVTNGTGCTLNMPYGVGGAGAGGRVHLTGGTTILPMLTPGTLGNFDGNCGTAISQPGLGTPAGAGVSETLP